MPSVVTFGEIMLRLATMRRERFTQAREFEVTYGGGECNVAVSLANFGFESIYVTAVPDNDIGQSCINYVRQWGVDTSEVLRQGQRLGTYYLENGAAMRASKVIYDRAASSIAELGPGEVDWERIFDGKDWFHFTGITPAISESAAQACDEAASNREVDGPDRIGGYELPQKPLVAGRSASGDAADDEACGCGDWQRGGRGDVVGSAPEGVDVESGEIDASAYEPVVNRLVEEFNFQQVGITLRESQSADDNDWSAIFYDGDEVLIAPKYAVRIVDRVGGGDAFSAGLIYGNLQDGWSSRQILDFAAAGSALAHTFHGDFNLVSVSEVMGIAGGNVSGRVQR